MRLIELVGVVATLGFAFYLSWRLSILLSQATGSQALYLGVLERLEVRIAEVQELWDMHCDSPGKKTFDKLRRCLARTGGEVSFVRAAPAVSGRAEYSGEAIEQKWIRVRKQISLPDTFQIESAVPMEHRRAASAAIYNLRYEILKQKRRVVGADLDP